MWLPITVSRMTAKQSTQKANGYMGGKVEPANLQRVNVIFVLYVYKKNKIFAFCFVMMILFCFVTLCKADLHRYTPNLGKAAKGCWNIMEQRCRIGELSSKEE